MRYFPIGNELFIGNRKKYCAKLKANSLAIFNSNDILPTNADGTMPFRQNNDLFYLCGIDQEETILLIFPECATEKHREILFVKETNELIAIWEGNKLTKKEVSEISGIITVYWTSQFEAIFHSLIFESGNLYLNSNEHARAEKNIDTKEDRFVASCKVKYPLHNFERSAPIMQTLRMIKSPKEIELIQEACNITEKGFRRALKFIKPGVMEFEIEAELYHEYLINRSRGPAYNPIIASGYNSCVLHYNENNRVCKDGDILLMDVAAEYGNYASDLTRTIPVNGKFTKRQKEVYMAVLRIMRACIEMLVPGNNLIDYQNAAGEIVEKELLDLRLLSIEDIKRQDPLNPLYKKYFMHGASHFLGLDVHDVGNKYAPFQEGMIFTCEPGIYIREEALGIRLENNILITDKGPSDLMKNIPIEPEELEMLMNK